MKKQFHLTSLCVAALLAMFSTSALANSDAPKNLAATNCKGTSAQLNWLGSDQAIRYQLQIVSTGTATVEYYTTVLGDASTTYRLDDLEMGKAYRFKVYALFADGRKSDWSEWRTFCSGGWLTPYTDAPNYDELYATDLTETSATLKWRKIEDATQYQVQVKGFIGEDYTLFQFDVENDQPKFKVEDLTSGHDYVFRVRGFNKEDGWGSWSDEQEFTTNSGQAIRSQKLWSANLTENSATLNWEKSPNADRYQIQIGSVDSENYFVSQINTGSNTTFQQTDLEADKTYVFRVRSAKTGGDWGEWSEIEVFTTLERNEPAATINQTGVKVSPNPASDFMQISLTGEAAARRLTLVSAAGQIVREDFLDASQVQHFFHVSDLPTGMYFLRTETNGVPQIQKVVITH